MAAAKTAQIVDLGKYSFFTKNHYTEQETTWDDGKGQSTLNPFPVTCSHGNQKHVHTCYSSSKHYLW